MEFVANESKKVEIETSTGVYQRHAIQTHFVQIGENYIDLIERYVKPLYEEGDLLSISEKVIALCQKRIVYRKDIHPGFWAKLLCRFVHVTPAGPGAGTPHKMQLIIMICGLPRVLLAAFCSAVTKLFGKKGVFYKVCGHEVDGIDGLIVPMNNKDCAEGIAMLLGNPQKQLALIRHCQSEDFSTETEALKIDQLFESSSVSPTIFCHGR